MQWVDGIITQGRKSAQQWVTVYNIYTSNDASSWNRQLSGENNDNTFPGNVDNTRNQFSVFAQPVKAQYVSSTPTVYFCNILRRYVKVVPVSWSGHISMRWSVLIGSGDEVRPCPPPLQPQCCP